MSAQGPGLFRGRSLGMLLLCLYLIVVGLLQLTNIRFAAEDIVLGLLALAAGLVLLFLG